MPRPAPYGFAFLRNRQFQQAHLIKAEQVVICPQPSTYLEQRPSGLIPFLFQHRLREPQGVAFYALVLFLRFGDVSIYGEQLLFQRGYDRALSTIMFGCCGKALRGFLRIGVGGLFAFGFAPCDGLCIRSRSVRFSLPGFGHVLYGLLFDLFKTGAEALTFFIQLLLIGFPVVHGLGVTGHQGLAVDEGLAAIDLLIQQVRIVLARIQTRFQLVVLVA